MSTIRAVDEEDYIPTGPCACGHEATAIWSLGGSRFEFRCLCCVIAGRLERAHKSAAMIPELEAEYARVKVDCEGTKE